MTDVVGIREPLMQQESVDFKSPVSEGTMFNIAQIANFNAVYQYAKKDWNVNGEVPLAEGSQGVDGLLSFFKGAEIVGYSIGLTVTGNANLTEIDVHRIDSAGVDQGTIFTTKPAVDSTAADNSASIFEYFDGSENQLALPTGHTKAEFNTRVFSAGDSLRFDVDNVAGIARNLNFTIIFRPLD